MNCEAGGRGWEVFETERKARERLRCREISGVPRRFWDLLDGTHLQKTEAVEAVDEFLNDDGLVFLVLAGGLGAGKTLAASVALDRVGSGLFIDATDLARTSWFDRDSVRAWNEAHLLIIDDLGTEYNDDRGGFAMVLDGLINARYNAAKRTIITTNLALQRFKQRYSARVMDRIRETGRYVELRASNMRRIEDL